MGRPFEQLSSRVAWYLYSYSIKSQSPTKNLVGDVLDMVQFVQMNTRTLVE